MDAHGETRAIFRSVCFVLAALWAVIGSCVWSKIPSPTSCSDCDLQDKYEHGDATETITVDNYGDMRRFPRSPAEWKYAYVYQLKILQGYRNKSMIWIAPKQAEIENSTMAMRVSTLNVRFDVSWFHSYWFNPQTELNFWICLWATDVHAFVPELAFACWNQHSTSLHRSEYRSFKWTATVSLSRTTDQYVGFNLVNASSRVDTFSDDMAWYLDLEPLESYDALTITSLPHFRGAIAIFSLTALFALVSSCCCWTDSCFSLQTGPRRETHEQQQTPSQVPDRKAMEQLNFAMRLFAGIDCILMFVTCVVLANYCRSMGSAENFTGPDYVYVMFACSCIMLLCSAVVYAHDLNITRHFGRRWWYVPMWLMAFTASCVLPMMLFTPAAFMGRWSLFALSLALPGFIFVCRPTVTINEVGTVTKSVFGTHYEYALENGRWIIVLTRTFHSESTRAGDYVHTRTWTTEDRTPRPTYFVYTSQSAAYLLAFSIWAILLGVAL